MENEEKEDLLLEVTESEDDPFEKDEYDCYIEEKILNFIKKEKQSHKSTKKTLILIVSCLLMFLSSSVFIVTLPIYLQYSSRSKISTYSKLVTLSTINACFFGIVHLMVFIYKWIAGESSSFRIRLPNVLKIGVLLSAGSIITFWLNDGDFISCHLRDPLRGCAVVFSFLFYFILARKRMSVERIFCAVTVIVGVFVAIDFGICDKFRCNGSSAVTDATPKLHFLYVILYVIAHGLWVLHLTYTEMYWTEIQSSNSNLSLSVLSNVSKNTVCNYDKESCQGLSIICNEGEGVEGAENENNSHEASRHVRKSFLSSKIFAKNRILKFNCANSDNSLNNSVPSTNQLSVPICKDFPITSTPVHKKETWDSYKALNSYDIALWEHVICFLIILFLSWLSTVSFIQNGKSKLLVEVIHEVCQSFLCHLNVGGDEECDYLFAAAITLAVSYTIFILSSMKCLKCTESAVTVVSILMLSLPMSSLWWSIYHLNRSADKDVLEFNPEITGETVCAMLGFPIIGIGCFLLIKSHIREYRLSD